MRIEFTVRGPAGSRDVAVSTPAATPWRELLPALARVVGAMADDPAQVSGRSVTGTAGDGDLRCGGVLTFGAPPAEPPVAGLFTVQVVGGGRAGDPVPLRREPLVVGRDPDCALELTDDRSSRRHACLTAGPGGITVHDLGSTNGTTVDGQPVPAAGMLVPAGSIVRIGDTLLATATSTPLAPAALMRGPEGLLQVNRAPRSGAAGTAATAVVVDRVETGRVAAPGRVQWLAALLPAAAGGVLAWVLASPAFLLFTLLSPVLLLGTALGDRLHWRRERRRAAVEARRQGAVVDDLIAAALARETAERRSHSPDPASVLAIALRPGRRLWERVPSDADHLVLRVGSADLESSTRVRDRSGSTPAGVVPAVPAVIDLRDGPIGIVGVGDVVDEIARAVLTQLAVLHAPTEVDLVVAAADRAERWEWCRWLPHVRTPPAPGPDATSTALAALGALLGQAAKDPADRRPGSAAGRRTIVIADRLTGADAAALAALLARCGRQGLTAICLAETPAALPAGCRTVVAADSASRCRVTLQDPSGDVTVLPDRITDARAERIARALAPLTDARSGAAVPTVCRLGDHVALAGIDEVTAAWRESDGGARTVIGSGRDGPVTVDLVADGPHALVAGTTGSGKSELLRSLVIGLAAGHPPADVSFLLVDYKGGAAFAEAVRLPHTTGVLTDLDRGLTARALQSLEAELRRRERLFAAAGADDLPAYRARCRTTGGEPVARLIIVVDEFAELAAELPDFVTGLVGVARRGRSLGVHLVLATQRPGAAVSAEIRANTSLRIALRVTEPVESTDVIGVPDAAFVDARVPGRAYARIGGRVVELKTAQVAADDAAARPVVETLDAWRTRPVSDAAGRTDPELQRVVSLIAAAARDTASDPPFRPWLPPLPDRLPLSDLDREQLEVPLGRLDRPTEQSQPGFGLDPAGDSVLIVGRARSGRTTTLLTAAVSAARRWSPAELQLHLIDGGGALADATAGLPHVGTLATRDGVALVPRLLERLADRPRASGLRSLLLVDDWDLVTSGQDEVTAAQWTESLLAVVRTAGPDLTVLTTGGRSLLLPRIASAFASRLVLPLADVTDYGMAGVPPSAVPGTSVPGAGIRMPDTAAFRIAHAGAEPTVDAVRAAVDVITGRWDGVEPSRAGFRLRALPETVRRFELSTPVDGMVLGRAGDTAAECVVDLVARRARFLVAGPARSGRSTLLTTLVDEARRLGHAVAVVAAARSPVRGHAAATGARLIDTVAHGPPRHPTLLVVDDVEACDERLADALADWVRDTRLPLGVVVAGRSDELITSYRALVTEVRRERCGVLLRPGVLDGELLGVRVRPAVGVSPPGRGVIVGDPRWGPVFAESDAVPIQIAAG